MRFGMTLVALSSLIFSACGPGEEENGTASAGYDPVTIQQAVTRVCGADRYTGVQGADVSKYQANFDWETQKNAGMAFGIARISDGVNTPDDYFDRNWAELKRLNMIRGAYQYFRPAQDVTAQANMVINKLGQLGPGDLPAVIDVESNGGLSKTQVAAKVKQWLQLVEAGTGKKPIIYTGPYFWQDNVGDATLGAHPLWIAHYGTTCPLIPDGWPKWTFWQYCDGNTDYCANGQGFDRNVFNGSLAELQALAGGGGADYGATYVNQTFPLASTTVPLVTNQTLTGYIELKNSGTKPWDTNTKLATTEPRDRPSPFADATWPAPNRPAVVTREVPPGDTFRFEFTMRAPNQPGVYSEYFGVVQEGVAWFSDPGQGGPVDNNLQVKIEVSPADFGAEVVDISFNDTINVAVGGSAEGTIELKNIGSQPWPAGQVFLAPTPRDQASPLQHSSWASPTRVIANNIDVAPGASYSFPLTLAGKTTGTYTQTFNLVKDNVWFSEAPTGGGPTDDQIALDVIVGEPTPNNTANNNANNANNANNNANNANNSNNGTNGPPLGFPALISVSTGTEGGCTQTAGQPLWFALLLGLGWLRRRAR